MGNIVRLWSYFERGDKYRFIFLVLCTTLSTSLELVSISLVIPIVGFVVADGSTDFPFFREILQAIIGTNKDLLTFFLIIFVLASFVRAFTFSFAIKFSMIAGQKLTEAVFKKIVSQDFSFFKTKNSADLTALVVKCQSLPVGVINPMTTIVVSFTLIIPILGFLVILNPLQALMLISLILPFYTLVMFLSRRSIAKSSESLAIVQNRKLKLVAETFGSIRELILEKSQWIAFKEFASIEGILRSAQASVAILSSLPKFFLEALAVVAFSLIIAFQYTQGAEMVLIIPTIAGLVFGFQRLLPISTQLYSAITMFAGHRTILSEVMEILATKDSTRCVKQDGIESEAFGFKELRLQNISYRWPGSLEPICENLNFTLEKGDKVVLTGASGSGKTTLVDLMTGLIEPQDGTIRVEREQVNFPPSDQEEVTSLFGYVPQAPFFLDGSFEHNLFGHNSFPIASEKAQEILEIIQVDEFICEAGGLSSPVGENACLLSGGQRQRLAIARALLKNPDILILDESLNAIPEELACSILGDLLNNFQDLTLVVVAHAPALIELFDKEFSPKTGWIRRP